MAKNKFTKVFSLGLIIILTVVLSACTNDNKYANKLEEIKAKGTIVLGTSADYPPYEFHKEINGKDTIVGFDIEVAQQIANDLGVKLVIKDMKFEGLLAALTTGNVDFVIASMTPTPDREKNVDFSTIYYTAVQGIIVRTNDVNKFTTIDSLQGQTIGVQKGTIQQELAEELFDINKIKGLGKISDLVLELKNNKIDALIVELPVANAYASKHTDLSLTNIQVGKVDGGSAVAVKKGNTELVDAINTTLERLRNEKLIDQYVTEANDLVE